MNIITEKQFNDFASQFFPGKAIHYDETYAFIQAGTCLGENLHYECDETSVNLHIEGPEWRPIRDYLNVNLTKQRLTPSHWGRQNCQWTIDNEIHTDADVMQAFLDIRSIIEPVIEQFEGKEPKDYSGIKLEVVTEPTDTIINEESINHSTVSKPIEQPKEKVVEVTQKEKIVPLKKEEKKPLFTITPIPQQPITLERTIDELGLTLSKTYDQLATAPIQGVDTAGRRTVEMSTSQLMDYKEATHVKLVQQIDINKNMNEVAKKCFGAVDSGKSTPPSYQKLFWRYLAKEYNTDNIQIEKGYTLKSTFGVVSLLPSFAHRITVAVDDEVSQQPTFCFDKQYTDKDFTPKDLVSIFDKENVDEIHDDEIVFHSRNFKDIEKTIGSYKTPKSFNNVCPECDGEKKIRCRWCDGSGREQYEEGEYADGRPKIKTGQCRKCYGRGFFVCTTCNETGKVDQGTGMIQIQETANSKLRLREKVVESNSFFKSKDNATFRDIKHIQTLEQSLVSKKKTMQTLRHDLKTACEQLVGQYNEYVLKYEKIHVLIGDHKLQNILDEIDRRNYDPVRELYYQVRRTKYVLVFTDFGINDILQEISNEYSSKSQLKKKYEESYHHLFSEENVEVMFRNQCEILFNNQHEGITNIIDRMGQSTFDFLYQQNIQKAKTAFKLDNGDERIFGILEKHKIDDTILKITVPLEHGENFVVYYSSKGNNLFFFGGLPKIPSVVKQEEEEKRREEERRKEEERIQEEKRQEKYSQSMDKLLEQGKTTKIGMMSKLFKTDEYKQSKDAEKAIKLMIYVAKADGTLDVDEKEFLTKKIAKDLNEGYTDESRQNFLMLLNCMQLPDLTTDDCAFRSKDVAKRVLENLVKLANVNGTIAKEERNLLESIASKMDLESFLAKLM